eukprot:6194341-Pleurochrysis_carterae.AAC.1
MHGALKNAAAAVPTKEPCRPACRGHSPCGAAPRKPASSSSAIPYLRKRVEAARFRPDLPSRPRVAQRETETATALSEQTIAAATLRALVADLDCEMSDVHALVTKKLHADASRAAAASRLQVSIFQAELTELDERRMEAERDLANATNQRDEWHEENMALEMKLAELEEALDNARNQAAYAEVRDVGVTSNGSRQHCLENSSDAESLASSHAQPDQSLPSEAKFNGDAAAQYDAKPARTEVDVQLRALSSELSSCEVVELQIRQRLIEQRRDPRLKLQSHIEQLQQVCGV